MIGPTDSSRAPAAIDVLSNAKVAMISPANSASGLSSYKSGGYYFRTSAADVAQASVLVKLAKDGGATTLAVVHEEGSYGKDVSNAVAGAAKAAGWNPSPSPGSRRARRSRRPLPRRQRLPTPWCWFPATAPRAPSPN